MLSKAEEQEGHYELCKNNDSKARQKRSGTACIYREVDSGV